MASIKKRDKRDGTASFTVLWRAGGARSAKQESEVFSDEQAAERFKDLVNGHGQQWPLGWVRGQGFIADQRRPGTMFESFALAYVDRLTGIQGDTRSKYKTRIRANMTPWFGPYSVEDGEGSIVREMVQDWVNDLEAGRPAPLDPSDRKPRTKYKPKTVQNEHGLLSSILQAAVDAEPSLRASNPCAKTRLPRLDGAEDEEEMVFLEREEWAWLHECLAEDAKDLGEAIAETGFRWGEATALQPRDLRRRNGRPAIRVQRAWKKDEDGKSILGPPKTRKSRRTIVITHKLDRMLRRRAKGLAPDALIFTGPEGGKWDPGTFRRLRWLPAIEKAAEKFGLLKRPRIHDLRHSHASWLIAAKVPLPAIQGRLGHESITTTVDRYGHLLDALDDEVMAAIEWAMDPTAPLPGFLQNSGLADMALSSVPMQPQDGEPAADGADGQEEESEPVFVVTCGVYGLTFREREHARDATDQWNDDHPDQDAPATVEERQREAGDHAIWSRMPDRQYVWNVKASYGPNGSLMYKPEAVSGRWIWEFESRDFTARRAVTQVERRTHAGGVVVVHARGINKTAVNSAFEETCGELTKEILLSPSARDVHATA
ncbi:site-specific integrase [Streptomyces sp. NBC_01387]|uniref:tyrosine-type recombinase/integrase n=1 Tax=unclassified Streptomyces TaxID=2593676 RepID=UPI00324AE77F